VTTSERTHAIDGPESEEAVRLEHDTGFDLDAAYRHHASDVSRWLRQLARRDDVSDLLHDVFVVAQRRSSDFRGDASPRTWLYAIAVRVVSSHRRKQRLRQLFFLDPKSDAAVPEPIDEKTPFSAVASKRASNAVHRVLDRLSERDRLLIVLFEIEGLSAAEIQIIAGLKENAVWVQLHRARKRFKQIFVDLYGSKE
jgi:RNA polymerase sigma-70 factor (ECF subfamily)